MERAIELTGLAKRRRYASAPGNPIVNFLQRNIEPVGVSKATYRRQGAATLGRMARGVAKVLEKGVPAPMADPLRSLARAVERYGEVATKTGEIIELFIPFMHDGAYLFRCDNTRRLFARMGEEDRARLPWYPEKIDWRHWFLDIHVPAIEKWVEPEVAQKLAPKRKPLRRHAHLWAMVEDLALRHGHAPALLYCEGEQLWRRSFLELRDRACGVAALLAGEGGVRLGDRVVLTGRNHPDWVTVYFGIVRAGGTVVPIDPDLPPEAFHNVLRACGARIVVRDAAASCVADLHASNGDLRTLDLHEAARGGDPRMAPPVEISAGGVASLIFTSGTTGTPKGVMLTHENFCGMIAALAPVFPLGGGDCALSVLPLHHTFEFTCGLLLPLASGARIV
ncbi:MAG: AMP-dependent synthetase, partial [Deltaproteobacteria bacterium]